MDELTVVSVPPAHEDQRGAIYNVVDDEPLRSLLYVTSESGTVRGNHYHKTQTQWVFVLDGGFELYFEDTREQETAETKQVTMEPGMAMKIPAGVAHAFEIEQDTEFIEVADKAQGKNGEFYDEDTVAVDDLTA